MKLLIVDDQALIREGIEMMLSLYDDMEVIGQAVNGREAVSMVEEKHPDVVLMDIRMPVMDGVEATGIIKSKYPDVKVLILTTFNEDEYIFQGLKNGADGYVLKDIKSDELIRAIRGVNEGNVSLHPDVTAKVVKAFTEKEHYKKQAAGNEALNMLTPREIEIAKLVASGKSNREIGGLLYITEGTVKNTLSRILDKLGLRDRTQLALYIKESHGDFGN